MNESLNYRRVEASIRYIVKHVKDQPSLALLSAEAHMSPFHFQRLFTAWAGISPKKFLQYLTVEELKNGLHESKNIIEAAESVGLTSQSRVYDLFVNIEAMTPQQYRVQGRGLDIAYGFHSTPFGECLLANTERGICALAFVDDGGRAEATARLKDAWPLAALRRDQRATEAPVRAIFHRTGDRHSFRLLLRGTRFQIKVWEALLRIPFAAVASYRTVAAAIHRPAAARAVASAVGQNPVAVLIPCHRVIRSEGLVGGYRWGAPRKAAMIGWEKNWKESIGSETWAIGA